MAEQNAQFILQMIAGYWVSQTVAALAQLKIPDRLAGGPLTANEIASAIGSDAAATLRLMRTAASIGLLTTTHEGTFGLSPLGESLRSDVPGSLRNLAIALTAPGHWLPWARLADAVREGKRQTGAALGKDLFQYYADNPAEGAIFTGAMADLSALVAQEVANVIDASDAKLVVDVGGASGILISAMLTKYPALEGKILELPHVAAEARAKIAERGLESRCEVIEGDFFLSVPEADIYILKHIIHDWDDERCVRILTNCTRAMRDNGRVVLVETLLPEDRRMSIAPLMDLNMLVLTPGRERTGREYGDLLRTAGLRIDRVVETQSPMQIIEASARRYFFPVQRRTNFS